MKKIWILFLLAFVSMLLIIYYNNKYDKDEIRQIEKFLEQKSENDKETNQEVLNYSKGLPLFWGGIITKGAVITQNKYTIKSISFFDKHQNRIARLKGTFELSDFKNLKEIDISDNLISKIVFANCPKLETVLCYKNDIKTIHIENCPNLIRLAINNNPIESIDITNAPNIKELDVADCPLKELKVLDTHLWRTWNIDTILTNVQVIKNRYNLTKTNVMSD